VVSFARAMEVFANSDTGCTLVALDEEGMVTSWGRTAQGLTGYSASEVIGKHFSVIWTDTGSTYALLQRALSHGEIVDHARLSGKDGARHRATRRATALRDEYGQTVGFVVMIIDARRGMGSSGDDDLIATALLDTVVHPIFAAGLELNRLSSLTTDLETRRRVAATIEHLDQALRNLRAAVADVKPPSDPT
jgi:PAS domain S-box-containing protein